MNVLSEIPASGRFGPARTLVSRSIPLLLALWVTLLHAAYPEQIPRVEPALLQPVAQPAAVQRPVRSVSSLQPGFVPAAGGYTASTQDYAVQLHSNRGQLAWALRCNPHGLLRGLAEAAALDRDL